jgi:hypothetical protein
VSGRVGIVEYKVYKELRQRGYHQSDKGVNQGVLGIADFGAITVGGYVLKAAH